MPVTSCSAWATTSASASSSCARARAGVARACPRTPAPSSTSRGEAGYDFSLLAGAIASNDKQLSRVVAKVEAPCGGSVDGATVAVWGLTFKANTDDRRDSPSLQIAHRLAELGANVQAFDPTVDVETDAARSPDLELCGDPYAAATGAPLARGAHGMGRIPLARLRPCPGRDGRAEHRRCPQPPRSGRHAPHGFPVHRDRAPVSRVVVAGGAGFLGSHLCDHLVDRGDTVVCLDDLSTGSRRTWPTWSGRPLHPAWSPTSARRSRSTCQGRRRVQPGLRRRRLRRISPGRSRRWPSGARDRAGCSNWPATTTRGS